METAIPNTNMTNILLDDVHSLFNWNNVCTLFHWVVKNPWVFLVLFLFFFVVALFQSFSSVENVCLSKRIIIYFMHIYQPPKAEAVPRREKPCIFQREWGCYVAMQYLVHGWNVFDMFTTYDTVKDFQKIIVESIGITIGEAWLDQHRKLRSGHENQLHWWIPENCKDTIILHGDRVFKKLGLLFAIYWVILTVVDTIQQMLFFIGLCTLLIKITQSAFNNILNLWTNFKDIMDKIWDYFATVICLLFGAFAMYVCYPTMLRQEWYVNVMIVCFIFVIMVCVYNQFKSNKSIPKKKSEKNKVSEWLEKNQQSLVTQRSQSDDDHGDSSEHQRLRSMPVSRFGGEGSGAERPFRLSGESERPVRLPSGFSGLNARLPSGFFGPSARLPSGFSGYGEEVERPSRLPSTFSRYSDAVERPEPSREDSVYAPQASKGRKRDSPASTEVFYDAEDNLRLVELLNFYGDKYPDEIARVIAEGVFKIEQKTSDETSLDRAIHIFLTNLKEHGNEFAMGMAMGFLESLPPPAKKAKADVRVKSGFPADIAVPPPKPAKPATRTDPLQTSAAEPSGPRRRLVRKGK